MINSDSVDIGRLFREGTAIDAAMNAAVREAVLQHKQKDFPWPFGVTGKSPGFQRTRSISVPMRHHRRQCRVASAR